MVDVVKTVFYARPRVAQRNRQNLGYVC
jgi:hypothetical protein